MGSRICQSLAIRGTDVVALCRQIPVTGWLEHPRIRIAIGDIENRDWVHRTMQGCDSCYHLAGLARQWTRDRTDFQRVNVGGTLNVLESAWRCGISKLVHTSSAGVFGSSDSNGTGVDEINEDSKFPERPETDYERSKLDAEQAVFEYAHKGLPACIVNPTRVFGPGPLTEANGLTRLMVWAEQDKWRTIPGRGTGVGNYVFIDDVVEGHLLAMERAPVGRRYILGGENLSYNDLFHWIRLYSQRQRDFIHVPETLILAYAYSQQALSIFGVEPKLTPQFARRYFANYRVSSERAKRELGYQPIAIEQGVFRTMQWIRENMIGPQLQLSY